MKLVQEGKLSPEDAAELIDAFTSAEGSETGSAEAEPADAKESGPEDGKAPPKDPFKGFVDFMEGLGRDVSQSVNWNDVAQQVRAGSRKGMDAIKKGIEEVKQGKVQWPWFGSYETREITLPLSLPKGKTLRVENPCGDVVITGGGKEGSVLARLKVRGGDDEEARDNAEAFTLLVEEGEHQVLIRQHDVPGLQLDLEIAAPGKAAVEVKSMSGDVKVSGTKSSCKVSSQSGDVSLSGLDGLVEVVNQNGNVSVKDSETSSLSIESKSGDVSLGRIQGNVSVRTASGDVTLHECSGKTLSVESVSGDVALDLDEPVSGTVNVRTVNGASMIAIADGSDCRVSLSTLRGDVHCDLELKDEARQDQHVTGRLGKGEGSIDVSAVNGNVVMKLRDHAATAAAT
jgi:hypothetical protein